MQASRDFYANLVENKFNTTESVTQIRMGGKFFLVDTILINSFFTSIYPEISMQIDESKEYDWKLSPLQSAPW